LVQTAFCEELFKEWSGSLDGYTAELKQKLMNDVKGLTTGKVLQHTAHVYVHMYMYVYTLSSERFELSYRLCDSVNLARDVSVYAAVLVQQYKYSRYTIASAGVSLC
jgi:hypothetical protein